MHALARRLHARVIAVCLLLSLLLLPLHSIAGDLWSDTPPSPSIIKELERYKAATSPEERAAAIARVEQLGESEPEAWNQLGIEYRIGKPADPQLAEAMFVKAAAAKNLNGLMNLIAVRIGDKRIAESCKAAEAARAWPDGSGAPAIAYLGECYRLGRNGPKDAAKAEPLLMEACRWGWEPACDSAIASLQSNPTPARQIAYRKFLEKLSLAEYMPAISALGIDASKSSDESIRLWGETLLQKASAAGYGEACTALALVLWGKGDASAIGRIDALLDCGTTDKRAPEMAWLFKGLFAGLRGDDATASASISQAYSAGLKQAGSFAAVFGYPVPSGADPKYCEHFCDWIEVVKEARHLRLLKIGEEKRLALIEQAAQERAAREEAELAEFEAAKVRLEATEAAQQAVFQQAAQAREAAQQAAYNAQIAAQNAEVRKERRRRFWSGVLTVALVLATGYVQAQADAYAQPAQPRPVYQPPSISAPYRPVYQPPASSAASGPSISAPYRSIYQQPAPSAPSGPTVSAPYRPVYQQPASSAPVGRTQTCYVQTPQGMQGITVNASQGCPVSLQSMGQPLRANGTGYLTGESVSGQIKICLYSGAAGQSSINISASGICPPSHQY